MWPGILGVADNCAAETSTGVLGMCTTLQGPLGCVLVVFPLLYNSRRVMPGT